MAKSGEVFFCVGGSSLLAPGSGWKAEVGDRRKRGSFFQVGGQRSEVGDGQKERNNFFLETPAHSPICYLNQCCILIIYCIIFGDLEFALGRSVIMKYYNRIDTWPKLSR